MNNLKKTILVALLGLGMTAGAVTIQTDVYDFKLVVKVPRVYDNTKSKGYRKYQPQIVKGYLKITYYSNGQRPSIEITDLYNKTHKMSNGRNVTYSVLVNNSGDLEGPITRVNLIGNNKTDVFKTPSVVLYMDAEPSYNVGEDNEDNSLLMTLAGSGKCKEFQHYYYKCSNGFISKCKLGKCMAIQSLSGYAAGNLGCGCYAYGHKSPTRVAAACGHTDQVDDVAATFGTFKATYLRTE